MTDSLLRPGGAGGDPPAGAPARASAALLGSAAVHGLIVLAALGLARAQPAQESSVPGPAPAPVRMIHLPPPAPAPQPSPAPAPDPERERPRPARPAAPPPRVVQEHDERAGSPALAFETPPAAAEPAPTTAPDTRRRPDAAEPADAPAAVTEQALMLSEAQRIFGRRARTSGPRGGPAAVPGFELPLPEQRDECRPVPAREPGAPVELATVSGRVYRDGTRIPLPGAHLQMVGTPHVTFSGPDGAYSLQFDPTLVDRCRTQYVRVTAPGFRAQTLVLYLGPAGSNEIPMRRR